MIVDGMLVSSDGSHVDVRSRDLVAAAFAESMSRWLRVRDE